RGDRRRGVTRSKRRPRRGAHSPPPPPPRPSRRSSLLPWAHHHFLSRFHALIGLGRSPHLQDALRVGHVPESRSNQFPRPPIRSPPNLSDTRPRGRHCAAHGDIAPPSPTTEVHRART